MNDALNILEGRLQQVPWLGGDSFSLADIAAAPFIDRLEALNFAGMWSQQPAVQAWILRLKSRPGYQAALPKPQQRNPPPLAF